MAEDDELMKLDVLDRDEQAHICIVSALESNCEGPGAQYMVERKTANM